MSREVAMTRRVTFSAGHRYWSPDLDAAQNRARFGEWASPFNHGHNFVLDVTVTGAVDPIDGMVVNIKRVDDLLRAVVVGALDGRSLNDEVPHFANVPPTMENLLAWIHAALVGPGGNPLQLAVARTPDDPRDLAITLTGLRLQEMRGLWSELDPRSRQMTLTRTYEFAAAHRLHAPALSVEENARLYGKCNHPRGHGHNYVLEVTVGGSPDPQTGMLVDLGALDRVVEAEIVERYDHRNLDEDVEELAGRVSTSENVALAIFQRLDGRLPAPLHRIRLWETARNCFEVAA